MTHSTGAWKHPTRPRASFSRARCFLIALAAALAALATGHVTVKAIANLAEFNATIRRDLEGGADRAACEQFHRDAITDALDADPNTEGALDALFAEFEN